MKPFAVHLLQAFVLYRGIRHNEKATYQSATDHDGSPFGMSQAVIDTASATVYISGQVDWDANHQVSCHTVEGQLSKVLANLSAVLDASGSAVESLLSLRVYVRGELGEFMEDIAPILAQFLGESRPSVTGIGVFDGESSAISVRTVANSLSFNNLGMATSDIKELFQSQLHPVHKTAMVCVEI